MSGIVLTPKYAYAMGHDAGMQSMRERNRLVAGPQRPPEVWNEDDYNAAAETTNKWLLLCIEDDATRAELQAALVRDGMPCGA